MVKNEGFDGSVSQIDFHTLLCFDGMPIVKAIQHVFHNQKQVSGIYHDDTYALTDWCICEMVRRAFPTQRMVGHYSNSTFEFFYDSFLSGREHALRDTVAGFQLLQQKPKLIKVLPLAERSLIALGY